MLDKCMNVTMQDKKFSEFKVKLYLLLSHFPERRTKQGFPALSMTVDILVDNLLTAPPELLPKA